jgi:hypothetical protein
MRQAGITAATVRRPWSVGYLLPRLVAIGLLVDCAWRLVPYAGLDRLDPFSHRLPGDAFVRNHEARAYDGYGDLAGLGNLPNRRLHRTATFMTDGLGFRNAGPPVGAAGILFGDSFGNAADSADQLLAAQLSRAVGCRIYNAASPDPVTQTPSSRTVLRLARKLGMKGGVIIVERVERLGPPRVTDDVGWSARVLEWVWGLRPLQYAYRFMTVSPAKLRAEAAFKRLQNDRILPNPYASNVVEKTLVSGDWMLFYSKEMQNYERHRAVSVQYWARLNEELAREGFQLLVVLVPNKYTVYHRWVRDPAPTPVPPEQFLAETEEALRAAGIVAINLTVPLQSRAADMLRRGSYAYLRDDTHWNSSGIQVAASEIAGLWAAAGRRWCPE